jgi:hypothetical protein
MLLQYILGPEYLRRPGNNELLFPLELVLFALGWIVAIAAWAAFDSERIRVAVRRERLLGRFVLPVLAFVAFSRYVPALVDAMSASPRDAGYRAGPTFFWAIAMLDLGVFLPATVAACIGLARRAPWAHKALYTVVGWFGLVGPAVAGMALVMQVNHDPNGSVTGTVVMTVLGIAFAALALSLYLPLLGADHFGGRLTAIERSTMSEHGAFTTKEARRIGEEVGIDWGSAPFDVEQLRAGMGVELEHGLRDPATNVTDDDPAVTAKVALAHLNEFPDYYTRLLRMEADATSAIREG